MTTSQKLYTLPTIFENSYEEDEMEFCADEVEIFTYQLHAMVGSTQIATGRIQVFLCCHAVDEYNVSFDNGYSPTIIMEKSELLNFLNDYNGKQIAAAAW